MEASTQRYSRPAQLLHWLIAGMIVLQFVLANLADSAELDGERFRQLVLLANHKSVGITILALALVRLMWRLIKPAPDPLPMPAWQKIAARISHWGFYGLMIAVPLAGWLMSSAANISVSWFNLFQLPDFVAPGESTEASLQQVHMILARMLFILALIHIIAALKHSLIDRDGALRRIASPASLIAFVAAIGAGLFWLIPESRAQDAGLTRWKIDYAASSIRFTAEQAGASFEGGFDNWQADLRFQATRLADSEFDVEVSVASVATLDKERDQTLQDAEFFDGDAHPIARYRASSFSADGDAGFIAEGNLEIKGHETPAPLSFTVTRNGGRVILDGRTTLDRIKLKVGTDEWEDTTWIGQFVDVEVHVEATVD